MAPVFPLRMAGPEAFSGFRAVLAAAGYTESAVYERLGITAYTEFKSRRQGRERAVELSDGLDVLIRWFLDEEYVPVAAAQALLPAGFIALMDELGLLGRDAAWPDRCYAATMLYPTRGLYICSDRATCPDSSPAALPSDVVYPAIGENTTRFMANLPPLPCDAFLDLGAGTGIAALWAAAHFARAAWAVDIASRSAQFAEFNARLNGLANCTSLEGDLYSPVEGLAFDRIVAHPPYVPVRDATYIFRDGGEDGEQIVRRIIEGIPRFLRPGGTFYCVTLGSDREDESFEQRIRRWLGEAAPSFDVVLAAVSSRSATEFISQNLRTNPNTRPEDVRYWHELFERLKIRFLFYGVVAIRRHDGPREPFTARVHKGDRSGWRELEWLLGWGDQASRPGFDEWLLQSRPVAAPELDVHITHRMRDGALAPQEFGMEIAYPFESECKCEGWIVTMVAMCNGRRTGTEIYQAMRDHGALDDTAEPAGFARVLRAMVASGFVVVESFELPDTATRGA